VFSVLLAREDDDEKADRIAERLDDPCPRAARQVGLEQPLREHREADREPRAKGRPPQSTLGTRKLAFALDADDLIDHGGAEPSPLLDRARLLLGQPFGRRRKIGGRLSGRGFLRRALRHAASLCCPFISSPESFRAEA